jgi:two-component sensor histidine kinase
MMRADTRPAGDGLPVALVPPQDLRRELESARRDLEMARVLLKDMEHRTRNVLQFVSSMLRIQARRTDSEAAREVLRDGARWVVALADIYRHLDGVGDGEGVRLDRYLAALCQAFDGDFAREVTVMADLEPLVADADVALPLGLIATEALMNALKHAFPEGRGGAVTVRLRRAAGRIELSVEDDGAGCAATGTAGQGMGGSLMRNFAARLDAALETGPMPSRGWRVRLVLPAGADVTTANSTTAGVTAA